ncbi:MAG: methyltransferase domain-containing protein [Candidatus Fermentibacteraceae bacterium]|nr:methyltransferase domain-containing protein [Candidatus Fermentibacteraceae bacterium]MBN2607574.1 methyltransferase domain-containing protein [Candidatus Fermentibacteraceae bacterium]
MSSGNRDWSEEDLRKHLVDARKHLWRESTIRRIVNRTGLAEGITAVDAGCGLGYLGWTFRPFYGGGGRYIGIDCSASLLDEAKDLSSEWSGGSGAFFLRGSVYDLPLPDRCSDLTMCQTLLMHLEHPEKALEEMMRVTRPGGVVMCMEPDNNSAMLAVPWGSQPSVSDDELLRRFRMNLIWARGRKKLGRGDWGIGQKVPKMMSDLGLRNVDVIHNDMPRFMNPPYETEFQRFMMDELRERLEKDEEGEKGRRAVQEKEWKECYLAGGGSLTSFYRSRRESRRHWEELKPILREQTRNGTYFNGLAGSHFYCVFGFRTE